MISDTLTAIGDDRPTIYLAGGFRSGWQDVAIAALHRRFDMLDPRTHGFLEARDYTAWDLSAIRRCDVVLACMEETNPGGYALALEVGYAHGLNKPIVFVDNMTAEKSKYFSMVREVSTVRAATLAEAIAALQDMFVSTGRLGVTDSTRPEA
jgi:nucleoside 2-deoxyribosyltransferase